MYTVTTRVRTNTGIAVCMRLYFDKGTFPKYS